jgi:hypothetical protein
MFGLRTGIEHTLTYKKSGVKNCCPGTNRSFAQMYQFGAEELKLNVAIASDLNGFIKQMKPRFGNHHNPFDYKALAHCPDRGQRLQNGLGSDFDVKGFAHIGLIGDVMRDLEKMGVDATPLQTSAERFLKMWERTYDKDRKKIPYNVDIEKALETLVPVEEKK